MKKLTHRQKQRLARRNMTRREIIEKVGIFQTEFWEKRRAKIREKILLTEATRNYHKRERNEHLHSNTK